jgi:6-phosphogluconolactonase
MKMEVLSDPEAVAQEAAARIAAEARAVVAQRGGFVMPVSGGHTPWVMLRALAGEEVPWAKLYIAQVDERVAPSGDPDRNLTHLRKSLLQHAPLLPEQIYAMPVESPDLQLTAMQYAAVLANLGLGPDGHTASLVPGDPVLEVSNADIGLTGIYQGRRRMTLMFPIINRARQVLWLITGEEKVGMLARLREGDRSIPAGRVNQERALVLADRAAAGPTKNNSND